MSRGRVAELGERVVLGVHLVAERQIVVDGRGNQTERAGVQVLARGIVTILDRAESPLLTVNSAGGTQQQSVLVVERPAPRPSDVNAHAQELALVRTGARLFPLPTRVLALIPVLPVLVLMRSLRRPLRHPLETRRTGVFALTIRSSCSSLEGESGTCSCKSYRDTEITCDLRKGAFFWQMKIEKCLFYRQFS